MLVVTTDDLRPALVAWSAHRTDQGTSVRVAAPGVDVTATIRAAHEKEALTHVLILGDVDRVPCAYRPAVAIAAWERDPRIATDAPYADLDDDGSPDLALGRIPADSVDEAQRMLARSIAYETAPPPGDWRRKLSIVAGVGGFGAQQDMALEMLTRMVLNRDVPEAVATRFTFAKESSPFCPPPAELQDTMLGELSDGALVVAYVGHGSARHVDRMEWRGKRWPILEFEAAERVDCSAGPPLVFFVACSTGSFDSEEDCLAEAVLRRPDGPAAIFASSRVSTPYSNGVLAVEMLGSLYGDGPRTVGEIARDVKRRLLAESSDAPSRRALDAMAAGFYEADAAKRTIDRSEHVLLYQLFGDPLLRLQRPQAAVVTPPSAAMTGAEFSVSIQSPVVGHAVVELVPRRDADAMPRPAGRDPDAMRADYARATRGEPLATADLEITEAGATMAVKLRVPDDATPRPHHVRVWIVGANGDCAAGGATIRIERAR